MTVKRIDVKDSDINKTKHNTAYMEYDWNFHKILLPIPKKEMDANPNMKTESRICRLNNSNTKSMTSKTNFINYFLLAFTLAFISSGLSAGTLDFKDKKKDKEKKRRINSRRSIRIVSA